ncbi:MAG: endo alpha-1,4 polygalactosaminidase [Pseudomonadota bacterium]
MRKAFQIFLVIVSVLVTGHAVSAADQGDRPVVPNGPLHWQLQGDIRIEEGIRVVDSDLNETTAAQVREWRAAGIYPVCYVNVGAIEEWRDDYNRFPSEVTGNPYSGWDGEYWLDISRFEVFADVMMARFDLCREKGFLAIEPDNIDSHESDGEGMSGKTGFEISRADQVRYLDWLIGQAHARGLAIGQKNAPELVPDLVGKMDFALLESAWRIGFMDQFKPYRDQGKPVFAVEYREEGADPAQFCPEATRYGFQGVIARLDLDRTPENCP